MLLISHSGGTFGTLNCANLLKVRYREMEGDGGRWREMEGDIWRYRGGTFGTLNCASLLKAREIEGDRGRCRGDIGEDTFGSILPLRLPRPLPLLKGFTEDIFCITSEWDTCIARLAMEIGSGGGQG